MPNKHESLTDLDSDENLLDKTDEIIRDMTYYRLIDSAISNIRQSLYWLSFSKRNDERLNIALRLLSDGLEKLLKVTILAIYRHLHSRNMNIEEYKEFKLKTHDLGFLNKQVKSLSKKIPSLADFNKNDEILEKIIQILSEYAHQDRYHDINVILGITHPIAQDGTDKFETLKTAISRPEQFDSVKEDPESILEIVDENKIRLIISIEKFVVSIAHILTSLKIPPLLDFNESIALNKYLRLNKDDLGKCEYFEIKYNF